MRKFVTLRMTTFVKLTITCVGLWSTAKMGNQFTLRSCTDLLIMERGVFIAVAGSRRTRLRLGGIPILDEVFRQLGATETIAKDAVNGTV